MNRLNKEVLGLNRRNQEYIRPLNSTSARRLGDNKLLTKRVLTKVSIKTPEVYKVIRTKTQLKYIDWTTLPKSFVIKPNKGTGGNGIIVIFGKKKWKEEWIKPNGTTMDLNDMKLHIENILEGQFSMGNRKDVAIIEERVEIDNYLRPYTYKGVPDIRTIVYNNVPVMAMLRLPTKRSDGTANLHSGAICVGIDIASGVTTTAMYMNNSAVFADSYSLTEETLDLEKNLPLSGIKIPYWDQILKISIQCQKVSNLGYLGVDIALDRNKGPVIFEINARPGLGIQVANQQGLRGRLERVNGLKIKSIAHGIRVAKNLFGGEVEEEIENISGKQVVNLIERIILYNKNTDPLKTKKKRKFEAVNGILDTGTLTTRMDKSLASRLGYIDAIKHFDSFKIATSFESFEEAQEYIDKNEKEITKHDDIKRLAKITISGKIKVVPVIMITLKMVGEYKKIEVILSSQKDMTYPIIIGRAELSGYLIDTSKTFTK